MIDLYYSATRGQYGIMMLLEEAGLRYQLIPVDIAIENQIRLPGVTVPADSRIPALVDHRPKIVHAPGAVFASCAVLFYLADKTARFIPPRQSRIGELQWIVARTGAVSSSAEQVLQCAQSRPERHDYALDRDLIELEFLCDSLDRRLSDRTFLVNEEYGIADIAAYPLIGPDDTRQQNQDDFVTCANGLCPLTIGPRPDTYTPARRQLTPHRQQSTPINRFYPGTLNPTARLIPSSRSESDDSHFPQTDRRRGISRRHRLSSGRRTSRARGAIGRS